MAFGNTNSFWSSSVVKIGARMARVYFDLRTPVRDGRVIGHGVRLHVSQGSVDRYWFLHYGRMVTERQAFDLAVHFGPRITAWLGADTASSPRNLEDMKMDPNVWMTADDFKAASAVAENRTDAADAEESEWTPAQDAVI